MADLTTQPFRPYQALAQQSPVQDRAVAKGLQAQRVAQMQQAVAQAPAQGPQAVQQIGAQQAAQAGQINLATAQQTVQQQQQLAGQALQAQAGAAQIQGAKKQLLTRQRADELAGKLAQIDKNLKNKLLDETISFEKDELNRTLFNERQLLDYKLQSQQADIALAQYEQNVQELSDKRMQMLKTAYAKIEQELSQQQQKTQQTLSQQQTERLQKARIELQQKLAREAARRKNRAAMIGAAGTIVGAVAGTIVAPGAGTAAGASIGGGLGQVAAAETA